MRPDIVSEEIEGFESVRGRLDLQGWMRVGNAYVYMEDESEADTTLKTHGRWVGADPEIWTPPTSPASPIVTPTDAAWGWWDRPEAGPYLEPYALGTGSYADIHPERYDDVWLPEIEEVARYIVDTYGLWVNTYYGHPPPEMVGGIWYDAVSLDIWGPNYRGDPSHSELVTTAFYDIFNNGKRPWIRWCIRNGWIWDAYNGWREYWDFDPWSDGPHVNHGHITFFSLAEA